MTSRLQFEDLLHMAKGNAMKGEKKIKQQSSQQFSSKAKKQDPKDKKLSEGVQKFLQQKALEEKRLAEEKRKQKEKLMELRSQDRKAHKRVNSMLRMTKSANKACIADAKNSFSDALVEQGDEQQPDEDDYGYVSQSSQEWHKKLLDKYRQIPASKPTRKQPSVHVPVPQSLSKSKSGQHNDDECRDAQQSSESVSNKQPNGANNKSKKRLPPPDAMNFQALLELANKKSQEPVNFCKPLKPITQEKETYEFGRPMTAKEKAAYLQEKAFKDKIASGNITLPPPEIKSNVPAKSSSQSQSTTSKSEFKIPSMKKESNVSVKSKPPPVPLPAKEEKPKKQQQPLKPPLSPPRRKPQPSTTTSKSTAVPQRRSSPPPLSSKMHASNNTNSRTHPHPPNSSRVPTEKPQMPRNSSGVLQQPASKNNNTNVIPSKVLQPPPNSSRTPLSNNSRGPPPNHSRMQPQRPKHLPPQKRRQIIESDEEEYDSEMDDFIADDEEEGGINYSDMIRALTGYDRNKYKNVDEGDIQESSVFEQWMEESRSARIGKLEDDEEERKEAEERRRKMLMKKKKMRR